MTLFSQASGRKIVSTATAETVGRVDEFVVDPASRSIRAVTVKKADSGDTLRWGDIIGFGDDAVTVAGADKIAGAGEDIAALSGKNRRMLGKRVLSSAGDELGKVKDVEFDPGDAVVTALHLEGGPIEAGRLIGIGSYAVVVQAQ